MSQQAFVAAHRFGFGPRPGDLERLTRDPRGWVLAQVGDASLPKGLSTTRSSAAVAEASIEADREKRRAFRKELRAEAEAQEKDLLSYRLVTDRPFTERMVLFWTNHFSVSVNRGLSTLFLPSYEREAIRPHVYGKFSDLLFSAVTHPAMVEYLDNSNSTGPNAPLSLRGNMQINENLARETLELYTLGVDGGYTQADVEQLSMILTGWAIPRKKLIGARERFQSHLAGVPPVQQIGHGYFYAMLHQPGTKTLLGKSYRSAGAAEWREAARDLSRHPSTARFLARKLAIHFVADNPPQEAVDAIAAVYTRTEGDLAAVSRAVAGLEAAWSTLLSKAKSPIDYFLAVHRALGTEELPHNQYHRELNHMGQKPWSAPSPQGWPDTEAAWLTPALLMRRISFADREITKQKAVRNPDLFLEQVLGPVAGDETRRVVAGASSGDQALVLTLASREFLRR